MKPTTDTDASLWYRLKCEVSRSENSDLLDFTCLIYFYKDLDRFLSFCNGAVVAGVSSISLNALNVILFFLISLTAWTISRWL